MSYSSNSSSDFIDILILFVIGPEGSRNMWQIMWIFPREMCLVSRGQKMSGLIERLCFVLFDFAVGAAVVAQQQQQQQ